MPSLLKKLLKTSFWILLLTLFTSAKSAGILTDPPLEKGKYSIRASGDLQKVLKGTIEFENELITSIKGVEYRTLKLSLKNEEKNQNHSIQFLISEESKGKNSIGSGTYRIANHIEGFMHCFDGVFGFANIKSHGELPFFANSGKIIIEYKDQNILKGTIMVTMKNPDNKKINISGSFVANKKRI